MARLETEGNNWNINPQAIGQRSQNQFRRPFNLQILNRERRNEDHPIQPPIRPNDADHVIDFPPDEEFIEPPKWINWMNDDNQVIHLTQNGYERFLYE